MIHGTGNAVPHGQQQRPDSDSESYTGSSASYTETASQQNQQPQQLQQQVTRGTAGATPKSASESRRHDPSRMVQPTSTPPQQQFGVEEDAGNNKTGGNKRDNRKSMRALNATINSPASRIRAVTTRIAGRDSQRVIIYVFFAFSLVHLLFVILSCTLSQIDLENGHCLTFWGYKVRCDDVSYSLRTVRLTYCKKLRSNLHAGAAFSILSILTSTATAVAAWIMCCRLRRANRIARHPHPYRDLDADSLAVNAGQEGGNDSNQEQTFNPGQLKMATIIIVAVSLFFELIPWAVIADLVVKKPCDYFFYSLKESTYGVGFGLGVTAWVVQIIIYVLYIVVV
ncbi:hypothetical protein ABL78_2033 [Leptomonas seymouri]|uniref:Amastin-like protein n=1 Tax=Leptomonas seymouri TaxID=5684 RepID=A0A0N0P7I8_LEPSE|nr:hypothetical protein ABL78_2033 [Leptomonas seymouri]|eukprot:KPI88839.1 hypothetical protein ABL78_2033 [Leptomonas seymouri]